MTSISEFDRTKDIWRKPMTKQHVPPPNLAPGKAMQSSHRLKLCKTKKKKKIGTL